MHGVAKAWPAWGCACVRAALRLALCTRKTSGRWRGVRCCRVQCSRKCCRVHSSSASAWGPSSGKAGRFGAPWRGRDAIQSSPASSAAFSSRWRASAKECLWPEARRELRWPPASFCARACSSGAWRCSLWAKRGSCSGVAVLNSSASKPTHWARLRMSMLPVRLHVGTLGQGHRHSPVFAHASVTTTFVQARPPRPVSAPSPHRSVHVP